MASSVVETVTLKEAVHAEPVWRERSNFIIGAELEDGSGTEQLWARQVGDYRFEICCIPFFLYDLALGDVVETDVDYSMTRVVESSGRLVFRVWFGDSFQPRDEVSEALSAMGALIEWSSANLLAVDAVDQEAGQRIADYLMERERAGAFVYETGRR